MGCATPSNLLLAGPEHKQKRGECIFLQLRDSSELFELPILVGKYVEHSYPQLPFMLPQSTGHKRSRYGMAIKQQHSQHQHSYHFVAPKPSVRIHLLCLAHKKTKTGSKKKQLAKTAKKHLCPGFMHNSKTPSQLKQIGQCFHPLQRVNKP